MIMHFTCNKNLLNTASTQAARAVSVGASAEILKGLLLECKDGQLTITGNDLKLGITTVVPADIKTEGTAVIHAKTLCEIAKRASGKEVEISIDKSLRTTIKCSTSVFDITSFPAKDYPALPKGKGLRSLTVKQADLKSMLKKILFSAAGDASKHIHTGILFDVEPEKLTLVALDGHRLAMSYVEQEAEDTYQVVIPADSLCEVERILQANKEAEAVLRIGTRHVLVELGGLTLITRIIEGEFFKYKTGIPRDNTFQATLEVKPLVQSLERATLVIQKEGTAPVKLSFSDGKLTVSCQTALGKARDDISCECSEILEIGFNHRYLLDALKHMEGERVRIEGKSPTAPWLLLPESDEHTTFMILPVRL